MINTLTTHLENLLTWLLVPATLFGGGGALMHARRKGKPARQTLFEVCGGAVTANMVCPAVQANTPEQWHYTLFFLVGWGGLGLVSRVYEAAASALERRIRKR